MVGHVGTLIQYPDLAIEALQIPRSELILAWHILKGIAPSLGWSPVILELPFDHDFKQPIEIDADIASVADVIAHAVQIDLEAWLAQQAARQIGSPPHSDRPSQMLRQEILQDPYLRPELDGFWLQAKGPATKTHSMFYLTLFPTAESWHLPAYLGYPAGNPWDGDILERLVAFARRWRLAVGAEVATLSAVEVEFFVNQPPSAWADALRLAEEHYRFCPDSFQLVSTLEKKAALLLGCPYWHFWWD